MKILVVDDEADVKPLFLQRFRKEIRDWELEFDFALSGQEALSLLEKKHGEIGIILSDINMPGMSGIELLSRIRQEYHDPRLPVLIISAYGDEDNRALARQNGADDLLIKPVDFNLLKQKIALFQKN